MAESFTALGAGNGFPFCLKRNSYINTEFATYNVGNTPTLQQAMQAYWNIKSITYGSAQIIVSGSSKNLICTPNQNNQYDVDHVGGGEYYSVSIGRPFIAVVNGEEYLAHGLGASHHQSSEDGSSYAITTWGSTVYNSKDAGTDGGTIYGAQGGGGSPTVNNNGGPYGSPTGGGGYYPTWYSSYPVGSYQYSERTNVSHYTINGIPFYKHVFQSMSSESYDGGGGWGGSFISPSGGSLNVQVEPLQPASN